MNWVAAGWRCSPTIIAGDLRDDYRALIGGGLDDDAATRQILGSYAGVLDDSGDGPVV